MSTKYATSRTRPTDKTIQYPDSAIVMSSLSHQTHPIIGIGSKHIQEILTHQKLNQVTTVHIHIRRDNVVTQFCLSALLQLGT